MEMIHAALFADVHGNAAALDAVLADIARHGITERFCLGDLVGYGPRPSEVIAHIRAEGIPTVMGNYDDGVGNERGECGCYYATEEARRDGDASYAFTDRVLSAEEKEFLAELPGSIRLPLPGALLMLTHGSPRKMNEYLLPDRPERQLARLADEAGVDVVCVGHIHQAYHRVVEGERGPIHYISVPSAGKPKDGDERAAWAELLIGSRAEVMGAVVGDESAGPVGIGLDAAWVGVAFRRVSYDVGAVADEMVAAGLPSRLADALRTGGRS